MIALCMQINGNTTPPFSFQLSNKMHDVIVGILNAEKHFYQVKEGVIEYILNFDFITWRLYSKFERKLIGIIYNKITHQTD